MKLKYRTIIVFIVLLGAAFLINRISPLALEQLSAVRLMLGTLGVWLIYLRLTYCYQLTTDSSSERNGSVWQEMVNDAAVVLQLFMSFLLVSTDGALGLPTDASVIYVLWAGSVLAGLPGFLSLTRHRVPRDTVVKINGHLHRHPEVVHLWPIFRYQLERWQFHLN